MKNYLVITLGTREIQIPISKIEENNFEVIEEKGERFSKYFLQHKENKSLIIEVKRPTSEFPDFYTLNSPRNDGEIIASSHFEQFQSIIDYPIIRPSIEFLKHKKINLDIITLIYTDQEEEYSVGRVAEYHKNNDSLFYAEILEKLIRSDSYFQNTEIDLFVVKKNVYDLAFQYDDFKRINNYLLYSEQVKQVFLYPQGGIDSINQALTLRLIETFKGKVVQLQKAEGADFKELDFPSKFLSSLNKQKVLKHLENYQFGLIDESLVVDYPEKEKILKLTKYAYEKLNLNYTAFPKGIDGKFKEGGKIEIKCKDLYLSAKINFHNQDYGNYLWKLFTLLENLYRYKCEKYIGDTSGYYDSKFEGGIENVEWIRFLKNSLSNVKNEDKSLFDYLEGVFLPPFGNKLKLNNPNRHLFKYIYIFLVTTQTIDDSNETQKNLENIEKILNGLSYKRNKIAHEMAPVSIEQLNRLVGENKIQQLNNNLDQIFNIQGFGIYDNIKKEIEALL